MASLVTQQNPKHKLLDTTTAEEIRITRCFGSVALIIF
jgi:hypothetical protein